MGRIRQRSFKTGIVIGILLLLTGCGSQTAGFYPEPTPNDSSVAVNDSSHSVHSRISFLGAGAPRPPRPATTADVRYTVGVDYHAYASDFVHTAFITTYNNPTVRQTVLSQLKGMAEAGADVISTRIWMVTEPGTTNFGETWRATFPLSDQEKANLHLYAQDVANVQSANGNRLRLNICLLWLGAADYTQGNLTAGLGSTPLTPVVFTTRVNTTIDKVLAAVKGVVRADGVPVVDTVYMEGEVMIGAKANQDWFLTTHYPGFVTKVKAAGFLPSVYFIVADTQANILQNPYTDPDYSILNNHRSQYWNYRSMKFMADHALPLPSRIDFSFYISDPAGADFHKLLKRTLDDADASLPSLGARKLYRAAETSYFMDDAQRLALGQAFATEAETNPRMEGVCFWTTPDGGGSGVNIAYPFVISDYAPPPAAMKSFVNLNRPKRP